MASTSPDRLEQVRQQLNEKKLDCLALVPGFNLRYLSGIDFMLLERPLILFILADPSIVPALVLPELEVANWKHHAPFEANLFPWPDQSGPNEAMRRAASVIESYPPAIFPATYAPNIAAPSTEV